jgi:hypothetical protein
MQETRKEEDIEKQRKYRKVRKDTEKKQESGSKENEKEKEGVNRMREKHIPKKKYFFLITISFSPSKTSSVFSPFCWYGLRGPFVSSGPTVHFRITDK